MVVLISFEKHLVSMTVTYYFSILNVLIFHPSILSVNKENGVYKKKGRENFASMRIR